MKITNYQIDGVDKKDYPDFCNAYLSYAEDKNGKPLSDNELLEWEKINYEEFYQMILESIK